MTTTFTSFSGSDIHAVFGDTIFAQLQMISYKQDREKAPVYTMGSPDLRTIARGKRLITGACVFVVFDRDGLLEAVNNNTNKNRSPHISKDEAAMAGKLPVADKVDPNVTSANRQAALNLGGTVSVLDGENGTDAKFTEKVPAFHLDQLLPFDITIVGANEYGRVSKMIIRGVELMTEAGGMSIDDLVLEKQVAFIARSIEQWKPQV
ncbi:hypothetical protein [uncultured Flavobacterium sp.]|uniref:hypothetical protein n=1 Tax=uncultured Flavobacterium sp. TaxID=165435 RepID=UPI0025984C86|nr:hypothetical protein [uncultured Flavobacterium sp.]